MSQRKTLALFNDDNARHIHQRLAELLAPEVDTTSWIDFTQLAIHHIPALASRGRPSKEEIANTFVGRLGFTSWSAYLTTDRKAGGLGWSTTGWKRYKEAYSLLQAHPWIRDAGLKPDQVRVLARTYGDDWPATLDEHQHRQAAEAATREERKAAQEKEKREQLEQLKRLPELEKQVEELTASLSAAQTDIERLNREIGAATAKYQSVEADRARLQSALDDSNAKLDTMDRAGAKLKRRFDALTSTNQTLTAELQQLRSRSFWGHLKAAFRSLLTKPGRH